jgi:hypothetical protein
VKVASGRFLDIHHPCFAIHAKDSRMAVDLPSTAFSMPVMDRPFQTLRWARSGRRLSGRWSCPGELEQLHRHLAVRVAREHELPDPALVGAASDVARPVLLDGDDDPAHDRLGAPVALVKNFAVVNL